MHKSNPNTLINALMPQVRPFALEQRFMFDAAAASTATDPQHTLDAQHTDISTADSFAKFAIAATVSVPVEVRAVDPALNNGRKEVAFIDTGVADYQTLVDGIRAGVEVVLLDAGQDGLAQMALWAQTHSGYDAIHVLSHGSDASIQLGQFQLSNSNLNTSQVQSELLSLGQALTVNGDLLIYGCDVAQDANGQAFVNALSGITGADIGASTDATGSGIKAGDWVLEYKTGSIQAASIDLIGYSHLLSISGTTITEFDTSTPTSVYWTNPVSSGQEYNDGTTSEDITFVNSTTGIYTFRNLTTGFDLYAQSWTMQFSGGVLDSFTNITASGSNKDTNITATVNGKNIIVTVGATRTYTAGDTWTFNFTSTSVSLGPAVTGVTSSTANGTYKVGDTVSLQANFSQAVNVAGTPQLTLETGSTDRTINYVSGSGTSSLTFNYTVQAGDTTADLDYISTAALTLNGGTIKDASNNNATLTLASPGAANSLGANKAIVIDGVVPTVSGVTSSTANATYKVGDAVSVQVNFSEAVTVTGTPQLTLETGTTDRTINYASGSGTSSLTFTYTVQAGDTTADLDYNATTALALNSGTIKDAAGNNATLTLASPGAANSLGANKAIVIDGVVPTVSGVTSSTANATYKVGDAVSVQVNFSEAVTVTGTPQLTLETGTTDRTINYASGSGTSSLTFTYTVQAGDTTADLDYNATTALALNSGTIKDAAGNNATLTLASPGSANSLGANKNIVVDGLAPSAIALTNNSLSNSASANTAVGTLSSTDATVGDTFTYSLVAGAGSTNNASFAISGSSLQASNPSALSAGSYSVRVRTTDVAGNYFDQTFSITVTSNQAPAVTTPTAIALTDTSSTDTFSNQTGTLSATDADGIASYGIQGGATGGSTVVGAATYDVSKLGTYGTLYVKSSDGSYVYVPNASAINGRLANTSETFTVTATDSNASAATGTATLTVNITGVNDTPTDIGLTAISVSQSGGTNATVGTLSTTDADTGDTHTYTLVSGAGDTNNGLFNISGTSLRATNAGSTAPGTYTVRVQTTDAASATYAEAITITVVDDVAPTVASVAVPTNAWYVAGQNLDFTVNFSESVTVDTTGGTPRVALTVGTTTVYATYLSGSGTSALVFRYTVQANDLDTNGISVGTLALNGGTLADATGNNAVLTLNSVGSTSSVLVDAVNPSAPTTPDLALASDSGTSGTDNITSDTTPTLTGTAEAGSTVTLYDTDGTTVLGTTTATGGNWSITSSTLSSGSHTITAKVMDAAGNVSSASAGLAITIDAVAPSAVALSTNSLADTVATSGSTLATLSATDSSGLTYSLVAGAGDTNNGRFTIAGTDLKAGGSNLAAGTYDIRVRATDAAGNYTDQTFTVTVTSGPSVASINRAGASALTNASSVDYTVTYNESVTGVDVSDFVLTTTGTAGGTIASISGSGSTYTVTVNSLSGDGTLRLDLNNSGTGIVNAGTQAITGGFTSGQTYTLDTTAPTAPSGLDMTAGSDSGSSSTDNITSVTTPTVTGGGAEVGATVKLYDTDGTTLLGTTTADGSGNWSITTSALTDGSHTLKAKVTDAAGNTGAASTGLTVTIDTTAPSAPSAPDLASASDSGSSSTDNNTSVTTPTLTGSGVDAGATVTLYDTNGTTVLGTATADGSGNWSITSSTLSVGDHTLTTKVTDAAGNTGTASASLTVTVDTTAPSAAGTADLATASDSGSSSSDNITNATTPTVTGSGAEAGATVTLYDTNGTTVLGTATADSSGNWSITSSTLSAGDHTLTTKVTDAAGNTSAASAGLTVTIDISAPSAPGAPDLASGSDAGTSSTDNITNATTPTITGSGAEAGATVTLYDTNGTTVLGTATADGSGNWSVTSSTLSAGDHTLSTKVIDAAGNTSAASASLTVTIDTTAPTASGAADLANGSDTGTSNTDNLTNATTPTVTGSGAEAGATVKLYDTDGTTLLGTATADGSGNWSITSSTLTSGAHTLTTKVTDAAGNTSSASTGLTVTVDTTAPTAPGAADLASASDSGSSSTDNITSVTTPTLTGSGAEAGATVKLYDTDGTTLLGTTTADGSGNWSITSSTLTGGAHTLTTKVTDAAGNTSAASAGLTVTIDTTAPSAPGAPDLASGSDAGTSSTDNITNATTPTITGSGAEAGATVTLYDTNGTTVLGTATVDGSGNWSITSSTLSVGDHTLTTKVTDAAGNTGVASAGLTVTIDTTAPTVIALSVNNVMDVATGTNTAVATLSSTDTQSVSYELAAGDGTNDAGNASFVIAGGTLQSRSQLTAGTYNIRIGATDAAGNISYQTFVITVDTNTAPTITSAATASVSENAATSTVVYTATATDVDSGQTLRYSLTGTDAGSFDIDASTGVVTLKASANYEVKASYSFNVVATDNGTGSLTDTKAVTVTVTNVNEAPTITSGATASVAENAATSTVVYTATANDVDAGQTLSYSLTGTDAGSFDIDASTGVVTLKASANYEAKASYSLNVVATDNGTGSLTDTKAVSVTVTDVNDPTTGLLAVAGEARQGQTLTVIDTLADQDGIFGKTYQWLADGVPIQGATQASYLLELAQAGKQISVQVRYTDSGNRIETLTSVSTPAVIGLAPVVSPSEIVVPAVVSSALPAVEPSVMMSAIPVNLVNVPVAAPVFLTFERDVRPDVAAEARTLQGFSVPVVNRGSTSLPEVLVLRDMADQSATRVGNQLIVNFDVPATTFAHTDPSAAVTLSAALADGKPLPGWLKFNPITGEFRGIAPANYEGSLEITVVATDNHGSKAVTRFKVDLAGKSDKTSDAGKSRLQAELRGQSSFAWKAERDAWIRHAREASKVNRTAAAT